MQVVACSVLLLLLLSSVKLKHFEYCHLLCMLGCYFAISIMHQTQTRATGYLTRMCDLFASELRSCVKVEAAVLGSVPHSPYGRY